MYETKTNQKTRKKYRRMSRVHLRRRLTKLSVHDGEKRQHEGSNSPRIAAQIHIVMKDGEFKQIILIFNNSYYRCLFSVEYNTYTLLMIFYRSTDSG